MHDIPQGNVLGGGASVNAQFYIRGRPSDYDEWNRIVRGSNDGADWAWDSVVNHLRRTESNNRLDNQLQNVEGSLLVSDPGHITRCLDGLIKRFRRKVSRLTMTLKVKHSAVLVFISL